MLEHILAALNSGSTLQNLQNGMDQVINESMLFNYGGAFDENGNAIIDVYDLSKFKNHNYALTKHDFTDDGVMEILFLGTTGNIPLMQTLNVFKCEQGKYIMSLEQKYGYRKNLTLLDLNNDTISEIILHKTMDYLHGPRVLYIYEWDGKNFQNLALPNETFYGTPEGFETGICSEISEFRPNANGDMDIIIRGIPCDFGEYYYTGPYRYYSITLTWDGTHFVYGYKQLDPPTYRFQAVQDGDWETLHENYEKALDLYNQALNDPNLKGWSKELYKQQYDIMHANFAEQPTPTPVPVDPNEKETLTACVHYRKMLIYTAQGKPGEALAEYMTVMKLSPGQPGYAYKGLAITFWKNYQNTQDLAAACIVTREYAYEHDEEIYDPIDDRWHGWQSPGHSGESMGEVICPFE